MKKLVIAEKPSVGRDIARVLGCKQQGKKYIEGNEYIVTCLQNADTLKIFRKKSRILNLF